MLLLVVLLAAGGSPVQAAGAAQGAGATLQGAGPEAPSEAEGAALLRAYLADTETLRARFEQSLFGPGGELLQSSAGELMIRRPDRFRWEYQSPYEQLIVADGERLWLYDPDLEQVTVRPQADSLESTPASLLSGDGDFQRYYRIAGTGTTADGLRTVKLMPRAEDGDFRYLALGFAASGELRRMELEDRLDQLTRIEFTDVRRDVRLRSRLFRFEPPEGVDVIEAGGAGAPTSGTSGPAPPAPVSR